MATSKYAYYINFVPENIIQGIFIYNSTLLLICTSIRKEKFDVMYGSLQIKTFLIVTLSVCFFRKWVKIEPWKICLQIFPRWNGLVRQIIITETDCYSPKWIPGSWSRPRACRRVVRDNCSEQGSMHACRGSANEWPV